ncbi:hypothetical protein NDN08_001456 [Rhodosorus marinus]|uniref:DUF4042 domain-containing protein n=1 Tax=Rhodosorus marinus TaxID=101924 RepID=A0AAV8UV08_9RHOD|nr:hypothetical protein NDN08_001456 [Rhodosorus marinus]
MLRPRSNCLRELSHLNVILNEPLSGLPDDLVVKDFCRAAEERARSSQDTEVLLMDMARFAVEHPLENISPVFRIMLQIAGNLPRSSVFSTKATGALVSILLGFPRDQICAQILLALAKKQLLSIEDEMAIASCAKSLGKLALTSQDVLEQSRLLCDLKKLQKSQPFTAIVSLQQVVQKAIGINTKAAILALDEMAELIPSLNKTQEPSGFTRSISETLHEILLSLNTGSTSQKLSRRNGLDPAHLYEGEILAVLNVLTAFMKQLPDAAATAWALFLPCGYGDNESHDEQVLASLILTNSSPQIRGAALGALGKMISRSRKLFTQPLKSSTDSRGGGTQARTSFMSLSEKMTKNAEAACHVLTQSLKDETNPTVLAQVVRCASTLAISAPPPSISETMSLELMNELEGLCFSPSTDATVRAGALSSIATHYAHAAPSSGFLAERIRHPAGLLSSFSSLYYNPDPSVPRAEIVLGIESMCINYAVEIGEHWHFVSSLLADALDVNQTQALRLHAVRCIKNMAASRESFLTPGWWWEVISVQLRAAARDSFHSVRATSIAVLATIPNDSFQLLDASTAKEVSTTILSGASDKDLRVRAVAVSAIGDLVGFERFSGIRNSFNACYQVILSGARESQSDIRARSLTSLSSLVEAGHFTDSEYAQIANAVHDGLSCSSWTIRAAAMRAAAALIDKLFQEQERNELDLLVEVVSASAADQQQHVKVRWNACHALAPVIPHEADRAWEAALQGLSAALRDSGNCKVCIGACRSLARLPVPSRTRPCTAVDGFDAVCWRALLSAIRKLEGGEYAPGVVSSARYKESLSDELASLALTLSQRLMSSHSEPAVDEQIYSAEEFRSVLCYVLRALGIPEFTVELVHREDDVGIEARNLWRGSSPTARSALEGIVRLAASTRDLGSSALHTNLNLIVQSCFFQ